MENKICILSICIKCSLGKVVKTPRANNRYTGEKFGYSLGFVVF